MKTTQLSRIVVAIAIGTMGTVSVDAAVRDLGVLTSSAKSIGTGISDSGRATGLCDLTEPGDTGGRAFRTAENSAINNGAGTGDNLHSTLGSLLGGFGVSMSKAYDIKQSGTNAIEIVGEEYGITELRPFWYYEPPGGTKVARELASSRGAALWVVPAPNGAYASAVVGWASGVNAIHNAIYWMVTPSQHWTYNYGNAFFPGTNSYATGTDVNRTVGYYITANGPKAFVIDSGARSFSVPAGTTASEAHAIRTSGTNSWVVGSYVDGSGYTKPILWTYTGNGNSTYVQLTLPSGKTQGRALGVNDGGIVGSAWSTNTSDEVACFWAPAGSVTTLNSVSGDGTWNLRRAYKVNSDAGGRAIVGVGTHTISGTEYQRGFVLYSWD